MDFRMQPGSDSNRYATAAHVLSSGAGRLGFWSALVAVALLLAAPGAAQGAKLDPDTLTAWDGYVQEQSAQMSQHAQAGPFLWSDQSADRLSRLRSGEILVTPVGETPKAVPHGLIHHWVGAIFLPNTNLADVLKVVRNYGKYKDFYSPNVVESKALHQAPSDDAFSLRILNKAVVAKFALDAEFQSSYSSLDKNRCYSMGFSTQIREIENYGQPDEHMLPPNTGRGLIWRLYNVSRFEQRDGGVYVEVEAIALSRNVPRSVRWLVDPVIRRTSKSSLLTSLQKTQEAVLGKDELAARSSNKGGASTLSNLFVQ